MKGRFQGDAGEVEYIWVKVTAMTDHGFRAPSRPAAGSVDPEEGVERGGEVG